MRIFFLQGGRWGVKYPSSQDGSCKAKGVRMATKQKRVQRQRQIRQQRRMSEFRHHQLVVNPERPLYASSITRDWEEEGIASIYIAREIAPGRVTMIAFLVDLWGMGLKDAWGRCDIGCGEYDEHLDEAHKKVPLAPVQISLARHMVYGGIERARDLGFRLPRRYERWTAVLGPLPPGEPPDMGLFGCDGKIVLMCSQRDLEARLVGTTMQELLSRPDVEYTLGCDGFTHVDPELDEAMDKFSEMESQMVDSVRKWCFATGRTPHPLLPEVVSAMFEALLHSLPEGIETEDDVDNLPDPVFDASSERMQSFLRLSFEDRSGEMDAAMQQLAEFSQSAGSFENFKATIAQAR